MVCVLQTELLNKTQPINSFSLSLITVCEIARTIQEAAGGWKRLFLLHTHKYCTLVYA